MNDIGNVLTMGADPDSAVDSASPEASTTVTPLRRYRPCRLLVLDAHGDDPAHRQARIEQTLNDLALECTAGERVDLFLGENPTAVDGPTARIALSELSAVVRHPATRDLRSALQRIQPDVHADVAWIQAGTRIAPGWRRQLQQVLEVDERIGSVSPLSLGDPWFSPVSQPLAEGWHEQTPATTARLQALREWLGAQAPAEPIELGGPLGAMGVLRGAAAVDLAADHDDVHWSRALVRRSWSHGVCRQVLCVAGPSSATEPDGDSLCAARELWASAHPLTGLRHGADQIWRQTPPEPPPPSATGHQPSPLKTLAHAAPAPVRLHVAHSWGGGLAKWVRDFSRADHADTTGVNLVLRSVGVFGAFGQRLALYTGEEDVAPLRYWELGVPIHATATSHLQVRQILQEIVQDFGVEQVIVSSLIGHSLDVLRTGLPTLMVAHDHHPFCVALYATFQGECRQCDGQRLKRCMAENPEHRFFKGVSAADWMALREAFVETVTARNLPITAPSPSVALRWQSMMPQLRPGQFRVIAHGLDLPPTPAYEPPQAGLLRLVVLGRLTPEKGAGLLQEMLPELLEFCEILLVGCGERLDAPLRHPRITAVAQFENAALPALLADWRPHVGLLMSTVPETFSYTLSELWHAGVPVVATASGALADRITDGVDGHLEPVDAAALLGRLRHLQLHRESLSHMRQRILQRRSRSLREMVRDYDALLLRPTAPEKPPGQAVAPQWRALAQQPPGARPAHVRALHVNPQITWMQALQGFWQFTCLKAARSPRLPAWVKRQFSRWT